MESAAAAKSRSAPWIVDFFRSALGKKAVMAATGIVLFGFVFVHMFGNLKLYLGPEAINHYGAWLRTLGEPALPHGAGLWIFRSVLLGCVALHITSAIQLWLLSRDARPEAYTKKDYVIADYASRTMRWGGLIVLSFIIWHLVDLTLGMTPGYQFQEGMPYQNLVASFSRTYEGIPLVALFYIVANILLGFHLYHGLWSLFQTLGWNSQKFNPWRREFATAFAVIITVGNVSFPLSVMFGLVK
jgi:succinate dehydrogenase / fumarate reductase cytochrome b subunit